MAEPAQRLSQIPGYYKEPRLVDLVSVKESIPYSKLEEGMLIRCTTRCDDFEHASLKLILHKNEMVSNGIYFDEVFSHIGYGSCWIGINDTDWTFEPVEEESARYALLEHMKKYEPSTSVESAVKKYFPSVLKQYNGEPEPKLRIVE